MNHLASQAAEDAILASQNGIGPIYFGQPSQAVFLPQNINAPRAPDRWCHMVLSGRRTSDFVVHFSLPMDPTSVQNISAYYPQETADHPDNGSGFTDLLGFGSGVASHSVVLKKAIYSPSTSTASALTAIS